MKNLITILSLILFALALAAAEDKPTTKAPTVSADAKIEYWRAEAEMGHASSAVEAAKSQMLEAQGDREKAIAKVAQQCKSTPGYHPEIDKAKDIACIADPPKPETPKETPKSGR